MTNPTVAAGGRVWQPANAPKKPIKRVLDALLDQSIGIVFLLLTITFTGLIIAKIASVPAEVISITTSSIQLNGTELNPGSAEEKIRPWIPTALGLEEAQVNETLLPSLLDGTKGTVTLKNGDTIPYTLHNDNNKTFTVSRG